MKKEFFDFVWKVIDKFGYPVLGAFILSIVTLVIAPDKYVEMVPLRTRCPRKGTIYQLLHHYTA